MSDTFHRVIRRAVFCASLGGAAIAAIGLTATSAGAQTMPDVNAGIAADAVKATLERNTAQAQPTSPATASATGSQTQNQTTTSPAQSNITVPQALTDADAQKPGFHTDPIIYSADIGTNLAGGATDSARNLPGTFDASLIYTFARTTRVAAYYYQFSAYPLGNDDEIPVVFQGTKTPIGYVNGNKMGINADTHLRFQAYSIEQLFTVGGRHHPLIFAPFYGNVRSSIGGADDTTTIFANNTFHTVHLRSYEKYGANLVIPLFYDINYFISYGADVSWNSNVNGANLTNHPQIEQNVYAQVKPRDDITLFASQALNIAYFPSDVYPYHTPTLHYGIAKVIKAPFFIEGEVSTTGPSNPNLYGTGRIGIPELVVPCASTAKGGAPTFACAAAATNGIAIPALGAQRATVFSLYLGVGAHPLIQPF